MIANLISRMLLLTTSLFLLSSCDSSSSLSYKEKIPEHYCSIANLKRHCSAQSVQITKDLTIVGRVVGNDRYDEFSRLLVLEDASGGIMVAVDHSDTANEYPFGSTLIVYCNGLTLNNYGGKIQLGTAPNDYSTGHIPREELSRYLHITLSESTAPEPQHLRFATVTQQHIDTYVQFDDVYFVKEGSWCETDPQTGHTLTTERLIYDADGNTFRVRTSGNCSYAKEPVPQGTGSIRGIIDYFNGDYSLRVVNRGIDFK